MISERKGTLSVQLYTFRDAYAADPDGTLERLAGLGFRYVEPFAVGSAGQPGIEHLKRAQALKRSLDAAGLKSPSAHIGAPIGEHAEAVLDALETLGIHRGVISWPGEVPGFERDVMSTLPGTQRFAEALNTAAANMARRGLQLGFHNHWWEWATLEHGGSAYATLLELLDPAVFMELDVYWAQTAGQDPQRLLTTLGQRAQLLHLKDGPAVPDQPQVQLGQGRVDNLAAIRAAPWIDWHILEMDSTDGDVFAEVAASAGTLIREGVSAW
ncbi:TIM barrel protein (plasmid) [Deinococcus radiomollis]|uniref:sugar phosphate isomerase/epimerase family protein n=1 Tax=Deinococcus radiomollis TaxID=468916 RepID=UPI003892C7A4